MNNRIIYLEEKLTKLRKDWKCGSPAMKKWIETGAKLLKEELSKLKNTPPDQLKIASNSRIIT